MHGLVEAAIRTMSGSSRFAVYRCEAVSDLDSNQLTLTFTRLFGSAESQQVFTIPATRHVHPSIDLDGNALIDIELGLLHITLRPLATSIGRWYSAIRPPQDNDDDDDDDVFGPPAPLPLLELQQQLVHSSRSSSSSSSSSSRDNEHCTGLSGSKMPKHRSLDAVSESAHSASAVTSSGGNVYVRQASSAPDVFAEDLPPDSPDVSQREPSDGDLVSYL